MDTGIHSPSMPFLGGHGSSVRDGYGRNNTRLRSRSCIALVLGIIALLGIAQWTSSATASEFGSRIQQVTTTVKSSKPIPGVQHNLPGAYTGHYPSVDMNSTLGFERTFVISLPKRLDNRDTLSLLRYSSGIDLEIFDGVYGTDIANHRMSYWDPKHQQIGALGSFRSHIDVWKKMVDEKIETALIMEEDVDWVADLDPALKQLQHPFASLLTSHKQDGKTRSVTAEDPWMHDDWDVLYLGACRERSFTESTARPWTDIYKKYDYWNKAPFLAYQDDSTPNGDQLLPEVKSFFQEYQLPLYDDNTAPSKRHRIITRSYEPWCTTAYAVSLKGAFRLLYRASMTMNEPADVAIGFAFQELLAEGYTVMPPLFGQWKPEKEDGVSDREAQDLKKEVKTEPSGGNNYNPWKGATANIGPSFRQRMAEKENLYNV